MDVDPAQIDLNPQQRARLAQLSAQTGKDWTELVDELLNSAPAVLAPNPVTTVKRNGEATESSLYDVLTERGILGCFDGPTDLSTNPKHMEGFGESRFPKNSG